MDGTFQRQSVSEFHYGAYLNVINIYCSIKNNPLFCKSCLCVAYCSTKCQNSNGANHAMECKLLSNVGSLRLFIDDKVRLIARIWMRKKVWVLFFIEWLHLIVLYIIRLEFKNENSLFISGRRHKLHEQILWRASYKST